MPPTFPSARSAPAIAAEVIALAAILVLAAYLRFDALGARSLWLDEFSTWHVSRLPLGQSLTWGPELTIPPLYQLLLRLLSPDPHPDEWVLRFPAAVAGLGAVAAAWWLGRTVAGAAAGCALAALMACNPLQIEYSREARPYSLLVLGCVLSTAAWYRLVSGCARRPTREWEVAETGIGPEPARWRSGFGRGSDATEWGGSLARQRRPRRADATTALGEGRTGLFIAYVAAAALACYSHYVAVFTIAAHGGWWLTRSLSARQRASIAVPAAALTAVAALCAPLALRTWIAGRTAMRQLGWIEPASVFAAWRMLEQIGFGGVWAVLLLLAVGCWGLARLGLLPRAVGLRLSTRRLSTEHDDRADVCPLLLWWLSAAWLGLLLVSWLITPLMVPRYALPAAAPVLLLPLVIAGRLRPWLGVALAVFVATASWPGWLAGSGLAAPGMRELVAFLDEHVDPRHEAVALAIYDDPNEADLERLALRYYPLAKVPVHELHLNAPPGGAGDAILRDPRAIYLVLFLGDAQPRLEAAGRRIEPIVVEGTSHPLLLFTQYRLMRVAPVRVAP